MFGLVLRSQWGWGGVRELTSTETPSLPTLILLALYIAKVWCLEWASSSPVPGRVGSLWLTSACCGVSVGLTRSGRD